ncbi:hypothetical protein Tco_0296709 [Tanacetum coccineum]
MQKSSMNTSTLSSISSWNNSSLTAAKQTRIMPPKMTTRSAGQSADAPQGGRTDGQGGDRGEGANRGIDEVPDFSTVTAQQLQNLLPTLIIQVGSQASNIQGDVRNVSMNNDRGGCSYKEFLACSPKDYDGKGGVIVYTRWTEKRESVQDISGCGDNQKVKYTAGSFIDFKALMKEEFCLNNEMQKLEFEFWCHAMVGAGHVAYSD